MRNNMFGEAILGIILIGLALFLLNPFGWWMPDMVVVGAALALVVAFGVFTAFVWRERPRDERELFHSLRAGRAAFLAGTLVLIIGIAIQSFDHQLDYWLVGALTAMLLTKLASIMYNTIQR